MLMGVDSSLTTVQFCRVFTVSDIILVPLPSLRVHLSIIDSLSWNEARRVSRYIHIFRARIHRDSALLLRVHGHVLFSLLVIPLRSS
jgi:hypothetical protein